jgi:uncharacterized membrane protein
VRLDWHAARSETGVLASILLLGYPLFNGLGRAPLFGFAAVGYLVLTAIVLLAQRDPAADRARLRLPAQALAWGPVAAVGLSLYRLAAEAGVAEPFWTLAVMAPLALLGFVVWRPSLWRRVWRLEPETFERELLQPVVAVVAVATLAVAFGGPMVPAAWHLPLLNPSDLATTAGVTVLALHWSSTRRSFEDRRLWGVVALGALGVTSAVTRVASAHFGVPFTVDAALSHVGLQAAISLLWSVLALGLLAFSRRSDTRLAWNIGIGLLALTTAKLLVLDLAAAGTLARIVSFVGVGILFLLVAFLMPAPGRSSGR